MDKETHKYDALIALARELYPDDGEENCLVLCTDGTHCGDTILVKGAGIYDGEWVVEDTMNRRFAGQDKIDFLVPANIKLGKWDNVEIYKKR